MDTQKKIGFYIGRFQPLHDGHKACIKKILETHDHCTVALRDTPISESDPLSLTERVQLFTDWIKEDGLTGKVTVISIPNVDTVFIGRDVGYGLIKLDEKTEAISATDIRKKLYEVQKVRKK